MTEQDYQELRDADLNIRGWWSPFRRVKRWFVENRVQRTIAYNMGMTSQGALPINATEDGALLVAPTGTGEQNHAAGDVTCDANWWNIINTVDVCTHGFVVVNGADANIRISLDGVSFSSDTIRVLGGEALSIDRRFRKIQAASVDANYSARVRAVGYLVS